MKYGAIFSVDVYDFDRETGETIMTRPSDYIQMQLWGAKQDAKAMPEGVRDLLNNYAIVYFALKRQGRLSDYGVEDGPLSAETLEGLSERVSVYVSYVGEDDLPMKAQKK